MRGNNMQDYLKLVKLRYVLRFAKCLGANKHIREHYYARQSRDDKTAEQECHISGFLQFLPFTMISFHKFQINILLTKHQYVSMQMYFSDIIIK